jgi:nucleotide-binding universal stress UspA family protein
MRDFPASSPAVVVGIDGSPTAVDAALWAVDEAVSRDIPLRLVYAIDPDNTSGTDPQDAARDLAAAEVAVRYAYTAVESTDKPVKIEVEILHERPGRALLEASRSAAMACVDAMDLRHSAHSRIGSTAAALAAALSGGYRSRRAPEFDRTTLGGGRGRRICGEQRRPTARHWRGAASRSAPSRVDLMAITVH